MSLTSLVALLDWDRSLRRGWTLDAWVNYLVRIGELPEEALGELRESFDEYDRGQISHDDLAEAANRNFALTLKGKSVRRIDLLAKKFVAEDQDSLYPFVAPLVTLLRSNHITPIVISGAPVEVVGRHCRNLGLRYVHARTLEVVDNLYTGQVLADPGVSSYKEQIVRSLVQRDREIVMAIGDSDSDYPLLVSARVRVVVDNPELGAALGAGSLNIAGSGSMRDFEAFLHTLAKLI